MAKGVIISPANVADDALPNRPGREVAAELGGRFLLRYLRTHQVGRFTDGTGLLQYVTPTPYAPEETVAWLALPAPRDPPSHVLFIDAALIDIIRGPRRVRLGGGAEYLLPSGFGRRALAAPGWGAEVR